MRSPADRRRAAEWVLRVALLSLLALALWHSLYPRAAATQARVASVASLDRALREVTEGPAVGALTVEVTALPSRAQRQWLRALRAAGVAVQWRGAPRALALAIEPLREPVSKARILLAADRAAAKSASGASGDSGDSGVTALLSDSAGVLDSIPVRRGGVSLESEVVGPVSARLGLVEAVAPAPSQGERRSVLVLGRAGWESRFLVAALAEAGWTVRARLPVAPGVAVSDAHVLPIDTARYDVVVALDSSAADLAPAIARFVASGGGLVAVGGATALASFRPLVPARAGARAPGRILLEGEAVTRADLPLRALAAPRSDAVVLERRGAALAAVVRRAGMGRVAAVGYDDSWRWRMQGGPAGLPAHRAWWSRMVGLVAPERPAEGSTASATSPSIIAPRGDPAPLAALVSALGPASTASSRSPSSARFAPWRGLPPLALLQLIAGALLAETVSRRFRGAR